MVVVSADLASTAEFAAYADGLLDAGLLQRVFVDECHTAITDIGYRARLGELKSLHRFRCPMALLTATLPVALEGWFREEMLAREAVVVRARTTKANCRYGVETVRPGRGAVEGRTAEVARRLGERMTGGQKGVIYCRSKAKCESLAGELGCDFHHSGMTEQARGEVRGAWAAGTGHRWITATSGLGTGIDIEGIVAVIHMEQPYGLVDFVQQTGRGGRRAGEVVTSVVIHDGRAVRADEGAGFVDGLNRAEMEAFVSTRGCRRSVLAAFMDGVAGERCGTVSGAEKCDHCAAEEAEEVEEAEEAGVGAGGGVWQAFRQEEGRRVRTLRRWLEEVADECAVCHVRRHQKGLGLESVPDRPRHEDAGGWCRVVDGEAYGRVRERVRFGELSCCYKCKLPLDWCKETQKGGGEGLCAYADKVLPVVLMAIANGGLRGLVVKEFGVDPRETEEYFGWLGRNRRFHGTSGTNVLAVWEAIVWRVYKGGRYWF